MIFWFPVGGAIVAWSVLISVVLLIFAAISYAMNQGSQRDLEVAFSSGDSRSTEIARAMGFPDGYEGVFSQQRLDQRTGRAWALTPGQVSVALCWHSGDRTPQRFFSYISTQEAVHSSIFLLGANGESLELRFNPESVIFNDGSRVFYAPVGALEKLSADWLRVCVGSSIRELTRDERVGISEALKLSPINDRLRLEV